MPSMSSTLIAAHAGPDSNANGSQRSVATRSLGHVQRLAQRRAGGYFDQRGHLGKSFDPHSPGFAGPGLLLGIV